MKRMLSLCLALVMVVTCCVWLTGCDKKSSDASSDNTNGIDALEIPDVMTEEFLRAWPENDASDFTFTPYSDGLRVDEYHGSSEVVAVPAEVDGKPVLATAIGVFGGAKDSKVRAVRFPASLMRTDGTFALSETIEMVIFDGLTICGKNTFLNCPALRAVYFSDNLDMVEYLGIASCENLKEIHFGKNIGEFTWDTHWNVKNAAPSVVIYGAAGTYAETFAKEQDVPFKAE